MLVVRCQNGDVFWRVIKTRALTVEILSINDNLRRTVPNTSRTDAPKVFQAILQHSVQLQGPVQSIVDLPYL